RQLLIAFSKVPAIRSGDGPRCSAFTRRFLTASETYANVAAFRPDGRMFCSGVGPPERQVDVSDRGWFRVVRATHRRAVGFYPVGPIMREQVVVMGYPVLDHKRLEAVVSAALDAESMGTLISRHSLLRGSAVIVFDPNGELIARVPPIEGVV